MGEPCLACGACCAAFRVAFDWSEVAADDQPAGQVPETLVDRLNTHLGCMRGTDLAPIRCVALVGQIGTSVRCGIYEWRPSPCREFVPGSPACNDARARHGLPHIG
ncbi:MAG: YkgJ family cysteine cluster protein [Burkholderiales bacterium]|jgi:Fe-S-cluster containining protein|nr:YkgJ family cysteine cluster protein [Nitrosomonadaceae bacterium]